MQYLCSDYHLGLYIHTGNCKTLISSSNPFGGGGGKCNTAKINGTNVIDRCEMKTLEGKEEMSCSNEFV